MGSKTENTDERQKERPISRRECTADGKRFAITRHFLGDKSLESILTEIAVGRANREMGV